MAKATKARKAAPRKTRNGDSYKGIPADKRKEVALTVGLVRAAGKRTKPGDVYLRMAQNEAAQTAKLAAENSMRPWLAQHDQAFQRFLRCAVTKPPGGKKSPTFTVQWPDE